ncbi:MAG: hypothetical protein RL735_2163, partial [Pseudomonadota bacterium]
MSEKLGPEKEEKRDLSRIFAAPSRWFDRLSPNARGALLVSCGSIMLVVMGVVTKYLGSRLPAFELQFFRSLIGFLFLLPLFIRDPLEP